MRKLLLITLTTFIMVGCSTKDKKQEQIKADIVRNAMGEDLDYTPVETKEVAVLTYNDYYDVSKAMLKVDETPEELIDRLQFIVDKSKGENDGNTYHMWKFNLDNLKKYQNANDKASTDVRLLEHSYTIINPMFNNAKVEVKNYYVFDQSDVLLGSVSDMDMKGFKKDFVLHDKLPYVVAYYEAIN